MKNSIKHHALYDKLLSEFHPTKNGDLKLFDFSHASHKKVWWKCSLYNDHEWEAPISRRTNGSGCSCCAGKTIVNSNCLATTHPDIAMEWHPTLNGTLTPYNITSNSSKKIFWKCSKAPDHEWCVSVNNRIGGKTSCPFCAGQKVALSNCLATINPNLSKEWHPTLNNSVTPYDVTFCSGLKVYWKCKNGHEWKANIDSRVKGNNCMLCSESGGEKNISIVLDKIQILYEREKKFDNCKNIRKLPFDFYLPDYNICIEYDGEQHFKPINYFGGTKKFNQLKLHDEIKTKFARENNIALLRIPYTEFNNVENIIISFIRKKSHKQ